MTDSPAATKQRRHQARRWCRAPRCLSWGSNTAAKAPPASPVSHLESAGCGVVGLAVEVLVEHFLEHALLRGRPGEKRHRRPQLLGVDRAEDGARVRPGQIGQDACTLHQPGPQHGVRAEGTGLGHPRYGESLRSRTTAQAGDLREDKPHPVAPLSAVAEFTHRTGIGPAGLLGVHKPLKLEGTVHTHIVAPAAPSSSRGSVGRRPSSTGRKPILPRDWRWLLVESPLTTLHTDGRRRGPLEARSADDDSNTSHSGSDGAQYVGDIAPKCERTVFAEPTDQRQRPARRRDHHTPAANY